MPGCYLVRTFLLKDREKLESNFFEAEPGSQLIFSQATDNTSLAAFQVLKKKSV